MSSNSPPSYRGLVDRLLSAAKATGQPADGTFEITSRCNLACGMCYVRAGSCEQSVKSRELSADQWLAIAREATAAGMVFLLLTGGEPLLRDDFFDIYEPLTELGLHLTLFTNGTLITPDIARRLVQSPPFRLEVTLYGASEETYEKVTGVSGGFERCCAGIEALLTAGVPSLLVKSTISRHSANDLSAMRRMAKEWNVAFSAGWLLSRRRDGGLSMVDDFRLTPEAIAALEADEGILARPLGNVAHDLVVPDKEHPLYCNAGRCSFLIDSEGTMMPCVDLPALRSYPLQDGFPGAWVQLQRMVSAIPNSAVCNREACAYIEDCPWCPAGSYLETGSYTEPVPYMCEVARARSERRGSSI